MYRSSIQQSLTASRSPTVQRLSAVPPRRAASRAGTTPWLPDESPSTSVSTGFFWFMRRDHFARMTRDAWLSGWSARARAAQTLIAQTRARAAHAHHTILPTEVGWSRSPGGPASSVPFMRAVDISELKVDELDGLTHAEQEQTEEERRVERSARGERQRHGSEKVAPPVLVELHEQQRGAEQDE